MTASDPNLPALAITYALGTTMPTKGSVVLNDASSGSFTYTPSVGQTGQDSFTFTASNGTLTSVPATITINIHPVVAPVAHDASINPNEGVPIN